MRHRNVKMWMAAALLSATLPLCAQIGVGVALNRRSFMCYEHSYACVTLRNDSGRPLMFGNRPELQGFVLFDIRDQNDRPVRRVVDREIGVAGLYLAPGELKRMVIPLDRYYDLTKPGRYRVYAYVSHNMLPREFRSKDTVFTVNEGLQVWKRTVGLPGITGDKAPDGGERTYSISVLDEGGHRSYYLKVEDPERILAVTRVGNMVGYEKFHAEVDIMSRIHLLMPVSPRIFHYMSFNVNGTNLASSYWKTSGSIPMLYRDEKSGKVTRIGGEEAQKGVDYRDPKEGRLSIREILEDQKTETPDAPRDEGVLDLGEHTLPRKAADEK